MFKQKNITGIVVILSIITFLLLCFVIRAQAEMVKAFYIKLAMVNFSLVVVSAGIYLTDVFTETQSRMLKLVTWGLGGFLVLFSLLISFNLLPFSALWNWAVVFGIVFILLVQLQLLKWGKPLESQLIRILTIVVILCDVFLVLFFIAKWQNYHFAFWIRLATFLSVALTIVGLILLRKK